MKKFFGASGHAKTPKGAYHVGERHHGHRKLIAFFIFLVLLAATGYYGYQQLLKDTQATIVNSKGTSRSQEIPNSATVKFDQETFAFDAPADWKLIKHDPQGPYNLYSYRATLKNADNRYLDIYVDRLPQALAVNKAVAVRAQANKLTHGLTSENCKDFVNQSPAGAGAAKVLTAPAKWDGVEFICDLDATTRNVIGTSSPGSVNKVTLTSPASGPRPFFFVYTDNNYTPDYSIFYNILDSFTVK